MGNWKTLVRFFMNSAQVKMEMLDNSVQWPTFLNIEQLRSKVKRSQEDVDHPHKSNQSA